MTAKATADPQIAASMDAARREAERWHNQMHAARHGYCPAPINKKPFDMYDIHSASITGIAPLHTALAGTAGHVFVAGETDTTAWCIRCNHPAHIWPEARVFITAGTQCRNGDKTDH